jgi:hypothetical protein
VAKEKKYAHLFQNGHSRKIVCTIDQLSAIRDVSWNMLIPLTQVSDLRLRGATNLSRDLEGVPREVRR